MDDDLDSLTGDSHDPCTNDLSEVEEMEAQMTPRDHMEEEGVVGDVEERCEGDVSEEQGGELRRCASAGAILVSGSDQEGDVRLGLCHRLHLSPRSSIDYNQRKTTTEVYYHKNNK